MALRTSLKTLLSISLLLLTTFGATAAGETTGVNIANGPYASCVHPADGADVLGSMYEDHIYTWLDFLPGADANSHEAFFSNDPAKVTGRDSNVSLGAPPYPTYPHRYYVGLPLVPPANDTLVRGTTYYWCVDETDANGLVWQSPVWSFALLTEKASDPNPPDGQILVSKTPILSWKAGYGAQWHVIYFGTNFDDVNDDIVRPLVPPPLSYRGYQPIGDEDWDPIKDGGLTIEYETTYYWRIDEGQEGLPPPIGGGIVVKGDVWSFTTIPEGVGTIGMELWWNISRDCWRPGIYCVLDYLIRNPEPDETRYLTSFNSGRYLGDDYGGQIHGWLHPQKSGDYTFWISSDDESDLWLSTDESPANAERIAWIKEWSDPYEWFDYGEPNQRSGAISLVGGQKYYIRAIWRESGGGDHCMVAWQGPDQPLSFGNGDTFPVIPGNRLSPFVQFWAYSPDPCDGQTNVELPVTLSWEPGDTAAKHHVFLGTNLQAVKNAVYNLGDPPAEYLGTTSEPNISAPGLAFNTKYYWRVDEIPPSMPPPWPSGIVYKGDVWSYTTGSRRIYVDIDAAGANNGTSWEDAYKYLRKGLEDANSSQKPVEIWVAQGVYRPNDGLMGIPDVDWRALTFQLINGVTIKGGYAGFGEPNPNARDIELYETILSGDLVGNDVDVNNPMGLLSEPTRVDNSYHVLTGSGMDASAILDGFTITAGHAQDNKYGGGMYNYDGDPTILNCTFTKNWAEDNGGGMYNSSSNPLLLNCKFTFNATSEDDDEEGGSGVFNEGSSPILENCVFIGNWADFRGGGMYNKYSNPIFTNCTFSENWAERGGAIYTYRDTDEEDHSPVLTNCTFSGNSANTGGAIYNRESSTTLTNCTFSGNLADNNGGGMYNYYMDSNPTVTNCIFWGNIDSGGVDESAQIYSYSGAIPAINYCCVQDWTGFLGGTGNIGDDPCFADTNNGDYHLKSQEGRWDANSESWVTDDVTSPCIDAGNPGCPVGDEPMPNGNRRNMGAYGGTAEASKSPTYWRSIADLTNDWIVDNNDLKAFVGYWLQTGECIPSDLNRSQFVDFNDFAIFGGQWQKKGPGPGITYEVDTCIPWEPGSSVTEEPSQTRFSVWVEGNNIFFEDLITANCCAWIELQMTVEGNLITIYEIEQLIGVPCPCICDYPVTATLGPFEEGTYFVKVIGINGNSLGVVEVTIGGPGITYQIEDCNPNASGLLAAKEPGQTRFTVTVKGMNIGFEDMMYANCCPDKLELQMTVEENLITIYEIEHTSEGCRCMCDFPIKATLGPFEPGVYVLEVYEDGVLIGSTTVTIL